MQQLSVLIPAPLPCYDYLSETVLPVGTFVEVPFGRKEVLAVAWDKKPDKTIPVSKIKKIKGIAEVPSLPKQSIQFVNWVAGYTLSPLGAVLKMALGPDILKKSKKPLIFEQPNPMHQKISFLPEQRVAVETLTQQICAGFSVSLLDGITGSGKTEVYFEAVAHALAHHKTVLILLPEITLTTAFLTRFEKRFGVKPACWHSEMTPKQRRDIWQGILSGSIQVVVGARSALFLPFQNLGLIVVDEEHDASYKQEEGVLYNARDMAIVRAHIAQCPIILASATPSLETYCNALSGKYHHLHLTKRFAEATLPDIEIVDMRQKEKGTVKFISPKLKCALADTLEKKEQALLFINRRGYAPLILCRECGARLKCPHCSAWLVEHRRAGYMCCHHCGYTKPIPKKCPVCQSENLISCGPGVERIYEEAVLAFPTAHVKMVTSDTLNNRTAFTTLLDELENGLIDILVGTQLLAKGHHFPNLTLVGVIDADQGLAGGDLRASERTFQLLHQVMGRAGRANKKGHALLQSYQPENMIIQALKNNNRMAFFETEIETRQLLKMPPFGRLAAVIFSGKNELLVAKTAQQMAAVAPRDTSITVLGPTPAPIAQLRRKYRYRLLIQTEKNVNIQNIMAHWLTLFKVPSSITVRLDIDPYSFF